LSEVEAETVQKPRSNRSAKDRRNALFRVLDGSLSMAHKKIHVAGNSDKAKQGRARYDEITVAGAAIYFFRRPKRFGGLNLI
jgi:hypothetical protein